MQELLLQISLQCTIDDLYGLIDVPIPNSILSNIKVIHMKLSSVYWHCSLDNFDSLERLYLGWTEDLRPITLKATSEDFKSWAQYGDLSSLVEMIKKELARTEDSTAGALKDALADRNCIFKIQYDDYCWLRLGAQMSERPPPFVSISLDRIPSSHEKQLTVYSALHSTGTL